ncbi:hypothetical protein LguiA_020995 [Lonicera macranthoides]
MGYRKLVCMLIICAMVMRVTAHHSSSLCMSGCLKICNKLDGATIENCEFGCKLGCQQVGSRGHRHTAFEYDND